MYNITGINIFANLTFDDTNRRSETYIYKDVRLNRLLIFLGVLNVVMLLSFLYLHVVESDVVKPYSGILDLIRLDTSQKAVKMSGEWEFFWDEFLTYEELISCDRHGQIVYTPKLWNHYRRGKDNLSGFGYATYRLKVSVEDPEHALSLFLPVFATSYCIFVNDTEIAAGGTVG